jgi:integrase
LVSAYSGLRLKNVVHLKRNEVNLKDGWLNIKSQSKTGKPVSVPITPGLRKIFKLIKVWPLRDQDRFFPNISEKPISIQEGEFNPICPPFTTPDATPTQKGPNGKPLSP